MFELDIKTINLEKENNIISKAINLDSNLDVFITISSKDNKLADLLLNKILDSIIDKIHNNNIHNKFWLALENINSFLNTWKSDWATLDWLDAIIWILRHNDLFFSTIWSPSCYLVNSTDEVIEVTDKTESKKEFWFILNWNLKDKDIVVFSNLRLLDYLSKDDLKDWILSWNIKWFNENIENIIKEEELELNTWLVSIQNLIFTKREEKNISKFWDNSMKLLDNKLTKKILALGMICKDKIEAKSKNVKNLIFLTWIIISFALLYTILSSVIGVSQNNKAINTSKENLEQAKEYRRIASENINNPDVFNLNIKKSSDLVYGIMEKKLFLNDTKKLLSDISLLNKQFNWIESFDKNSKNTIFSFEKAKNAVKVIKVNNKLYIINKKSIVWPIIKWEENKEYPFKELAEEDDFIDAIPLWTDILLLTKTWKVVNFAKSSFFSYVDVKDQWKWEKSNILQSYSSNIYLLSGKQIYKHKKEGKLYSAWTSYLKEEDTQNIWDILSIAIDWWIYIIKKDLSIVKFFKSPKYRIENIVLNKLPKNYNLESEESSIKLVTRTDLNYIYMLLNKRILIFKPNTKRYQNVKSLAFLWQIEGWNFKINDFYVNHDWEIIVLWEDWLFKLGFEVSDDVLLIK